MQELVPAPADPETFRRSQLDPSERSRGRHARALALHRDLIRLRRTDPTLAHQGPGATDGAVLGPRAFVIRRFDPSGAGDDRLLVANLGAELRLDTAPEPLLAPPDGQTWRTLWSSEDPRYGGGGVPDVEAEAFNWRVPGQSLFALAPRPVTVDEHRDLPGSP